MDFIPPFKTWFFGAGQRYLDVFRISIFGFRIYHTMNVYNINPYRVESVPGPLDPGNYFYSMLALYNLKLFETTVTLLMDMASAAMMGCSSRRKPGAASNG